VAEAATNSAVWSEALSADGNWLASGSENGSVQVWPVTGGPPRFLEVDEDQGRVSALVFGPQGQWVVAGWASGRIAAYRWPSQDKVGSWPAHSGSVRALAFSPDGTRLVTGGNEGTVVFWELPGFRRLTSLVIPPDPGGNRDSGVSQLAFDRLGRWLVALTEDGRLVAWLGRP
jgi:WD40 repeat protein